MHVDRLLIFAFKILALVIGDSIQRSNNIKNSHEMSSYDIYRNDFWEKKCDCQVVNVPDSGSLQRPFVPTGNILDQH